MAEYSLSKTERKLHDRFVIESTKRCQKEPFIDGDGRFYYPFHHSLNGVANLIKPAKCYVCKHTYKNVHTFYHRLCPMCAKDNFSRRDQREDLEGYQAIVTGGRIKIGYYIALRLLRCGASVLITTRFPNDALSRFSTEDDFHEWKHRLEIYGIDFRFLDDVMAFIDFLKTHLTSVDILINNAAQTIKRSDDYYLPHIENEKRLRLATPDVLGRILSSKIATRQKIESCTALKLNERCGLTDEFNEPVDTSLQNSWVETLGTVTPREMVEAQVVNSMVPFLLCGQLKPLFLSSKKSRRFIVNVSSMEGKFNRKNKTRFHPHTNMAKAALNMMTRTSAIEYKRDNIYMNSVDTGWITQEHPLASRRNSRNKGMVPPLDCIDGAARVLAPVFDGISGEPQSGLFLKDYRVSEW